MMASSQFVYLLSYNIKFTKLHYLHTRARTKSHFHYIASHTFVYTSIQPLKKNKTHAGIIV